MRVLLPQAGLNMFAIDEEVLGEGPRSAERDTGAGLEGLKASEAKGERSHDAVEFQEWSREIAPRGKRKGAGHGSWRDHGSRAGAVDI